MGGTDKVQDKAKGVALFMIVLNTVCIAVVVLPRPGTVFASRTLVYIIMGPTAPLVRSLVSCPFVNTDPY